MGLKASHYLLSLTLLLVFSTVVTASNITRAFAKYSNFSTMSDLFIKTKLTIPISKYRTITVLAVSNDAISSITNRSDIELKNILMTHVILDYYDELKLNGLKEKSIMLTTLYQTTGLGEEMNGFINLTKSKGRIYFGSEVKGSPLNAEYVKTLYHNPYNLSIIQISMPIVAPGLSLAIFPPPPPPAPLAPAPSPMDAAMSPAPGPADEDNASDTAVPKPKPATETPEVDSPAPTPSADNLKIEAADKAGPSSSACKAGLSFDFVLLLAFFASFAAF
ncbi:fasciclin-like arabinogalactan protein 5 isoform X2 [Eutrema salsugineum]|uniref:fasciclin-like arabinogalactan protein 5 isoform X2 n=1 Tax=Eutrema salsugineum TaxID=72664 RepID=UPI000CED76D3|nr:fasciclin-like arabinogalactan protein 5 isoform X2 [Eutrema salsugineum]